MNQELTTTYTVNVGGGETVTMTGNPDRLDEIAKLMKESAHLWTHIDKGLPEAGEAVEAAWAYRDTEAFRVCKSWIDEYGVWVNNRRGPDEFLGWRVYAWRPRREVEAPPLKPFVEVTG